MSVARGLLLMVVAVAGLDRGAVAQEQDRNPVGWSFSPAAPNVMATLSYDDCATCYGETVLVSAGCTPGQSGTLRVLFPNGAAQAPRSIGRALPFTLRAGGVQLSASGRADDYQGSAIVDVPMNPSAPLFAAMERAPSLQVSSAAGSYSLDLRKGWPAVAAWRAACLPPAAVAAPAAGASAASFGALQRYADRYDSKGFLREPRLKAGLAEVMPAFVQRRFIDMFEVVGPIQLRSGLLVMSGGVAHMMNDSRVFISLAPDGRVEAAMLADDQLHVFGRRSMEAMSPPLLDFVLEAATGPVRVEYR